jgi:NADH dehydrogenase
MEKRRVVIVGAGFGGVYTYRHLSRLVRKKKDVEIILINPSNYFLFTPLLHEVATGGIPPEHTTEPLRKILGCPERSLVLGTVEKVFFKDKKVTVRVGDKVEEISYDILVLASGSKANVPRVKGAEHISYTLKTMEDAVLIKNRLIEIFEKAVSLTPEEQKKLLSFVIIGGGPTGVELSAEVADLIFETFQKYYRGDLIKNVSVTLVHKDPNLLSGFSPFTQKKSLVLLQKKGIAVVLGKGVLEVGDDFVALDDGTSLVSVTTIWTGGVVPVSISFDEEVAMAPGGRMITSHFLTMINKEDVFILGDMAHVEDARFPKGVPAMAQVAVQEAALVAKNIVATLYGKKIKSFRYKPKGELVSLGQWMAAGKAYSLPVSGAFAWWVWRAVYLSKMISFTKRCKVALDWIINTFLPRDISELYKPNK